MRNDKNYFFEYKGEIYESDDILEVAGKIYEMADRDEELLDKVLKAIADKMVNEEDIEEKRTYSPYEEAFNHYFDEALDKLKEMKLKYND